jgi:AraC family transcriptional regulator of adaptative response / DNA-3-methyladenine glycosylase II
MTTVETPPSPSLRLAYHPPFDWAGLLEFFAPRAVRGVESVENGIIRRTLRLQYTPTTVALIEVTHADAAQELHLRIAQIRSDSSLTGPTTRDEISKRTRSVLDLDLDPEPRNRRFLADPILKSWISRWPGIRLPGAWDRFEMGIRAILGQQVSVRAAHTFAARFAERWGQTFATPWPNIYLVFPSADQIAMRTPEEIASIGIPLARARTIHAFAHWFLLAQPTPILDLPGIGPWTASYLAMRGGLRRGHSDSRTDPADPADSFPAGDLGIHKALGLVDSSVARRTRLAEQASVAWRPFRAYATILLWRSLRDV